MSVNSMNPSTNLDRLIDLWCGVVSDDAFDQADQTKERQIFQEQFDASAHPTPQQPNIKPLLESCSDRLTAQNRAGVFHSKKISEEKRQEKIVQLKARLKTIKRNSENTRKKYKACQNLIKYYENHDLMLEKQRKASKKMRRRTMASRINAPAIHINELPTEQAVKLLKERIADLNLQKENTTSQLQKRNKHNLIRYYSIKLKAITSSVSQNNN